LQEVRLVIIFNRGGFVAGEGGNGSEADWTFAVILFHEAEHVAICRVEAEIIDFHEIQSVHGDFFINNAVTVDVGIVADALKNAVGNTWGEAGAGGEKLGGVWLDSGI